MANDTKAEDMIDEIRDAFTAQIRETLTSVPPHAALQLADALCSTWMEAIAGLRVSAPAPKRIDGDAIAEDWARGLPVQDIVRRHHCSRRTAYNYHPNGAPKRRRKRGEKKVQQNP